MRIQVKDFMSHPVQIAVATEKVATIRSQMNDNNIHACPVLENHKLPNQNDVNIAGIITGSDINNSMDGEMLVSEVMSNRVYVIHKDASAKSAAKMMKKHSVHHLVVMDEGKIVGMLSSLDFVELVAEHSLG